MTTNTQPANLPDPNEHTRPAPPDRWLLATDDITAPMQDAIAALELIEGIVTLIAKTDSDGQPFTAGAWECLNKTLYDARQQLEQSAALVKEQTEGFDFAVLVPSPQHSGVAALDLFRARKRATGK